MQWVYWSLERVGRGSLDEGTTVVWVGYIILIFYTCIIMVKYACYATYVSCDYHVMMYVGGAQASNRSVGAAGDI